MAEWHNEGWPTNGYSVTSSTAIRRPATRRFTAKRSCRGHRRLPRLRLAAFSPYATALAALLQRQQCAAPHPA
jgi:hypothetical protein